MAMRLAGRPRPVRVSRLWARPGAGHAFAGALAPDQAARIFTGAPVPQGAVSVALQEDVTAHEATASP